MMKKKYLSFIFKKIDNVVFSHVHYLFDYTDTTKVLLRLTCYDSKKIFHLEIGLTQQKKEFYLRSGICFPTLRELIAFYTKNDIQHRENSFRLLNGVVVDFNVNIRTVDRWIIKSEDIVVNPQPIDSGHFGSIYRGLLFQKKIVVVKAIKEPVVRWHFYDSYDDKNSRKSSEQSWNAEIEAMKTLQHENIVLLHGSV